MIFFHGDKKNSISYLLPVQAVTKNQTVRCFSYGITQRHWMVPLLQVSGVMGELQRAHTLVNTRFLLNQPVGWRVAPLRKTTASFSPEKGCAGA